MELRQLFKNDKGLTLVELLAAIGLLGVVTLLLSSIIFQVFESEERTNSAIHLKQDTNVLINEIRNQYFDQTTNTICVHDANYRLEIEKLALVQIVENGSEKELETINGCTEVDKKQPLQVSLTTAGNENQKTSVQTTLNGQEDLSLHVQLIEKEEEVIIDDDFIEENEGNCNVNSDGDIKVSTPESVTNNCTVSGSNIAFDEPVDISDNGSITITDAGTVSFSEKVSFSAVDSNSTELKITNGDTTFNGEIEFTSNHNTIEILNGTATFNRDIHINSNHSTINIRGNSVFNGNIYINANHAEVTITGDANFNGNILFDNSANTSFIEIIDGSVTCKGNHYGPNVTIDKDHIPSGCIVN